MLKIIQQHFVMVCMELVSRVSNALSISSLTLIPGGYLLIRMSHETQKLRYELPLGPGVSDNISRQLEGREAGLDGQMSHKPKHPASGSGTLGGKNLEGSSDLHTT